MGRVAAFGSQAEYLCDNHGTGRAGRTGAGGPGRFTPALGTRLRRGIADPAVGASKEND